MTYDQWEAGVPTHLKEDSLWKMKSYRLGLFLGDLAWHDALKIAKKRILSAAADQLYRATNHISPNISEGYSRGAGRDRARFYEYALGSARESRDWCYKSRHALDESVVHHRIGLCTELVRMLLQTVSRERLVNRRVKVPG